MMWIYQIKQSLRSNSCPPKTLFHLLHREKGIELASFLQALDELYALGEIRLNEDNEVELCC